MSSREDTHEVRIGQITLSLPIREVAPGIRVAILDSLGDWPLNEAAGRELAAFVPKDVEVLVMPDGKATALLHVVGRITGLPTFVARKAKKPYLAEPVIEVSVKSITTEKVQTLCLGADQAAALRGKKVAMVDDVVSTAGTLDAMKELLKKVGAIHVATLAILTEGTRRSDVITLGHIPLF